MASVKISFPADSCYTGIHEPEKITRYIADNADDDVIALNTFYRLLTRIITQATGEDND